MEKKHQFDNVLIFTTCLPDVFSSTADLVAIKEYKSKSVSFIAFADCIIPPAGRVH